MKIILISTSIWNASNKPNSVNTSSEKFELTLIKNMYLKNNNIKIISTREKDAKNFKLFNSIKCYGLGKEYKVYSINLMFDIFKCLKKLLCDEETVIFYFGYNPTITMSLLFAKKRFKSIIVSYTFDNHWNAIRGNGNMKKYFTDKYFKFGLFLMRYIDGYIFLNKAAYKYINSNKQFLVSSLGVDKNIYSKKHSKYSIDKSIINIFYTGSLCDFNGIKELIEDFGKIKKIKYKLHIYGDGPEYYEIKKITENVDNIILYGRVNEEKLNLEMKSADIFINYRIYNPILNDFSFPSKLLEYAKYKKPIITSKFTKDFDDLLENMFIIDRNEKELEEMLDYLTNNENNEKINDKINKLSDTLGVKNNWCSISYDIIQFFENLVKKQT